ncbi:Mbeg1-like protein [Mesobacillus maritimus]|uniref:DUF2974 domain-containing protein n=1 Tax=Mesobacillus maritimus TaxID=1643336 RepID=A0ABS7KA62_9BACI|nr:Mbeg1-like protein [Mesobacillus maritimus]MBY0099159.1 DUF2974 domain-containing protein [Mesobacillus maritimus]
MALSDQDLKFATDLAYLDLGLLNEHMPMSYGKGPHAVKDLFQFPADGACYPQEYFDGLVDGKDTFGDNIISLDAGKINRMSPEALDWKVVKTYDQNNEGQSGFYGVVIDTGEGLVVTFRGSEAPTELQNIHQDWLNADIALLEGQLTEQQQDVNAFLDELKAEGYFEKYNDITFAGHSLGGNLAEHGTFYAAEIGVIDRLERTISYDGPGFAQEYLDEHRDHIQLATENVQMDHIEQSLVGGLLQKVPGVDYMFADLIGKGAVQHGTENVHFDENGKIVEGRQTALAAILTPFTQGIDRLTGPLGASLMTKALVGLTTAAWWVKDALVDENGNLTSVGKGIVTTLGVGLAALLVKVGPIALVAAAVPLAQMALTALTIGVVFVASVIAYEFIMDAIEAVEAFVGHVITVIIPQVLSQLAEAVASFAKWTGKQLAEFGSLLASGFKAMVAGLSNLFGGIPKAVASSHIRVDTYKLRNYASRLESVSSRISSVDSNLNMLYLTEGFLDIINLAIAENLPTKGQINKVINYLEDTASDFDGAEGRIMTI